MGALPGKGVLGVAPTADTSPATVSPPVPWLCVQVDAPWVSVPMLCVGLSLALGMDP